MKQLLSLLAILISLSAFSQSLYKPVNPDSVKLSVQVNGAIRYSYIVDLTKNKANISILNNYLLKSDTAGMLAPYLRANAAAATYQPILVNGVTLKSINGISLLGSGNINLNTSGGTALTAGDTATLNVHTNGYNDLRYSPLSHTHAATDITGTKTSAFISDFQTAVTNNTNVAANTAARHTHSNLTALNNVSGTNTGDETGASIVSKLQALTGVNRLDASAIQNLPAGGSSNSTVTPLTSSPSISWDYSSGNIATLTLANNAVLSIANTNDGDAGYLIVTQDATGGRTITLPDGTGFTVNAGANKTTTLGFVKVGGTFRWNGDYIVTATGSGAASQTGNVINIPTNTGGTGSVDLTNYYNKTQVDSAVAAKSVDMIVDTTLRGVATNASPLGVDTTVIPTIWSLNKYLLKTDTSAMLSPYLRANVAAATYQPKGSYLTSFTETDPLALKISNNLSDLNNAATARTNLGLGTLATLGSASLTSNVSGILPVANGGTNSSSFTSGRINYFNGTSLASSGLQWDNTNSWLGINTTPTHPLTIPSATTGIALYNTADQTTNYERARMFWSGNTFNINTENAGTGAPRNMVLNAASILLQASGTTRLSFATTTITGGVSIGYSASTNGSIIGSSPTLSSTTGTQNLYSFIPAIGQGGTGGYKILWISPFEQTLGSGVKYLIDAGTNSAVNGGGTHTSKFSVDNAGNTLAAGTLTASNLSGTNTGDETGATIKTKLTALTGTNRLDASAIQNLPSGSTDTTNLSRRIDSLRPVKLTRITIMGQSQAEGAAHVASLASYPLNLDTFHFTDTLKRVWIWNTTRSQYEPMIIGVNNRAGNDASVIVYPPALIPSSAYQQFGPELGIAQRWIEENPSGILLIDKWVADGQKIGQFGKDTGHVWTQMVTGRALATAWLKARNWTAYDKGWMFVQGNADNGSTQTYYQTQLTKLIRDLQWNNYINTSSTLVVPQDPALAQHPEQVDVNINNARLAVAANNPNMVVFTYDTTTIPEDHMHADAYSQLNMGYNAYKYIFNTSYKKAWYDTTINIGGTTELLSNNSDFSNAAWTKTNATVTVNATTDPDGGTAADKLIANTTNGQHAAMQQITKATTAKTYTLSVSVKRSGTNMNVALSGQDATGVNAAYALYDLGTGAVTTSGTGGTTFSLVSTSITAQANGFYKCTITFTTGTENNVQSLINIVSSATETFAGNGTDGVFLYNASLK